MIVPYRTPGSEPWARPWAPCRAGARIRLQTPVRGWWVVVRCVFDRGVCVCVRMYVCGAHTRGVVACFHVDEDVRARILA